MATPSFDEFGSLSSDSSYTLLEIDGVVAFFPLPKSVNFETRYDWGSLALGFQGFFTEAIKSMADGKVVAGMEGLINTSAGKSILIKKLMPDEVGQALGIAPNPKETLLFRGVKQREFTLTFDLASKSMDRMQSYITQMNGLYRAAAPGITEGAAYLIYPLKGKLSIIDRGTDVINPRDIAIQRINTNLNPDGNFATYTNGVPVHMTVDIDFIEVNIPSKTQDASILGGG